MLERSFVTRKHTETKRDYLARVNNFEMPKYRAAELAKQWGFDYWDGDRSINYGGHYFKKGYWEPTARGLIETYSLNSKSAVLDVGCGKGFLLKELSDLVPGIKICGLDVSNYAIQNAHPDIANFLKLGHAAQLPFSDNEFDLVYSINTLHNLYTYDLHRALSEMQRVGENKFICVESYRNELEKQNLLYWQVTCEAFNTPEEWLWWFNLAGYTGDYEFIFFE
jgi:SAM-dependent methyltransferase